MLYSGRLDAGKNVPLLFDYFTRYKAERPRPLTLALSGTGDVLPPARQDMVALGFRSEEELRDAYAAATLFCQPSLNESFSNRDHRTPVLAAKHSCPSPRRLCRHERTRHTQRRRLDFPVATRSSAPRSTMRSATAPRETSAGAPAGYLVEREYNWDAVIERLLDAIAGFTRPLSLYEQLSRRGVRRALEFSRERFEERFGEVIARAEADLAQGLTYGQLDKPARRRACRYARLPGALQRAGDRET